MAGPVRVSDTYAAQEKDAFAWAAHAGTTPVGASWSTMVRYGNNVNDKLFPYEGFTSLVVGRKHTKYKLSSPPESWERLRAYVSFYTSGFQDGRHVQDVKLRLYFESCFGVTGDTDPNPNPVEYQKDWALQIYTVSGGYDSLNTARNPDYGFGYAIGHYDAEDDQQEINYEVWGAIDWPIDSSASTLEQFVVSGMFAEMAIQSGVTVVDRSEDGEADPVKFTGWVEFPIDTDYVNTIGETHFRLAHMGERYGHQPDTGPSGFWNNFEYGTITSYEGGANAPQLVITYTTPATYEISNLRLTDLSVNTYLQSQMDLDPLFSGVKVLDGFPENNEAAFQETRNISLEHVASRTEFVELGSKRYEDNRRFFVDLVCDNRGELLDLEEKVQSLLMGSIHMYDYRYGFQNPPTLGRIRFRNLRSFEVPKIIGPDRSLHHAIVSVDAHYLRSG